MFLYGWRCRHWLFVVLSFTAVSGCVAPSSSPRPCVARSQDGTPIVEPLFEWVPLSKLCLEVMGGGVRAGSGGGGPEGHFDDRSPEQWDAIRRVRRIGTDAVPFLLGQVRCGNRSAVWGFDALRDLGRSGVPELLSLMRSSNAEVSLTATWAVGFIGPDAYPAVPLLAERLLAGDFIAGVSLGNIGPAAAEAIPLLIDAYKAAEEPYRRGYAIALSKIGPQAAEVVPSLLLDIWTADNALKPGGRGWDREAVWTRQRLVEALGGFRGEASGAVAYLIKLLEERGFNNLTDLHFARAVIRTIGEIGPGAREALPLLEQILQREFSDAVENHFGIREAAAMSIEMILRG